MPGDGETKFVCPHASGAKSWLPSSYNPRTKMLYVPLLESCMDRSVWIERQRAPQTTGTLATAGGVVFAGALDRVFAAYDDMTGKELWHARLGDVPSNAPISYTANGKQYVAMVVGNGGAQAITFPGLVPEIRNAPDRGAGIWVFELPTR